MNVFIINNRTRCLMRRFWAVSFTCTMGREPFISRILILVLKVSKSRKQFLKSSIFQNLTQKIWRISALCTSGQESFKFLGSNFGKLMISKITLEIYWPLARVLTLANTITSSAVPLYYLLPLARTSTACVLYTTYYVLYCNITTVMPH